MKKSLTFNPSFAILTYMDCGLCLLPQSDNWLCGWQSAREIKIIQGVVEEHSKVKVAYRVFLHLNFSSRHLVQKNDLT